MQKTSSSPAPTPPFLLSPFVLLRFFFSNIKARSSISSSFSPIALLPTCYTWQGLFFLPSCQGASLLLDFSLLFCFVPALPPGSSRLVLALSLSVPPATIFSSSCTPSISPTLWLSQLCGRRGLQPWEGRCSSWPWGLHPGAGPGQVLAGKWKFPVEPA